MKCGCGRPRSLDGRRGGAELREPKWRNGRRGGLKNRWELNPVSVRIRPSAPLNPIVAYFVSKKGHPRRVPLAFGRHIADNLLNFPGSSPSRRQPGWGGCAACAVPGSAGSYRQVMSRAWFKEGDLTRGRWTLLGSRIPFEGLRKSVAGRNDDQNAQEVAHRNRVFCWRYQGLTAIERPAYDVAILFGLPPKPEASRNGKSRLITLSMPAG